MKLSQSSPRIICLITHLPIELSQITPVLTEMQQLKSIQISIKSHIIPFFYTSENETANVISFFSGVLPSHHKKWRIENPFGLHTPLLTTTFKEANFEEKCWGKELDKKLLQVLGFTDICTLNPNNPFSELETIIQSPIGKKNSLSSRGQFLVSVFSEWNPTTISQFRSFLQRIGAQKSQNVQILLISIGCSPITSIDQKLNQKLNTNKENTLRNSCITIQFFDRGSTTHHAGFYSIIDFAPSLLHHLQIKCPYAMVGKNFPEIWGQNHRSSHQGKRTSVLIEHESGAKTLITEKYKLTIFIDEKQGEIFDRQKDPMETKNLWEETSFQSIKQQLFLQMLWAQFDKESMAMPRIAGA